MFDPTTRSWTRYGSTMYIMGGSSILPTRPRGVLNHRLVADKARNDLYLLFGTSNTFDSSEIWRYRISEASWELFDVSELSFPYSPPTMSGFAADIISNNTIVMYGGVWPEGSSSDTWFYRPPLSCNRGQYWVGANCVPCSVGTFANTNTTACTACRPGTFASATGSFECVNCSTGFFNTISGATSCTACSATMSSLPGSTSCSCRAGFEMSGRLCNPCSSGTFKSEIGNTTCTICPANTFSSSTGSTTCITCSANSGSIPGSLNCSCLPGFEVRNGNCLPCVGGTSKTTLGNQSCTICPTNTFSPEGSTACFPCGTNSNSTANSTNCSCNAGFSPNGRTCSPCALGTFKSSSGNGTCMSCNGNTISTTLGSTSCTTCKSVFLIANANKTQCVCDAGFEPNDIGECAPCTEGSVKAEPSNATCAECPENTYSTPDARFCLACGPNSMSLAGFSSCICLAGHFPNGTQCSKCSAGTAKSAVANTTCLSCLPGNYQNATGSLSCEPCQTGFYQTLSGQASCVACPLGTFSINPAASATSTCINCPVNTYADTIGNPSRSACKPCAGNASTLGVQGANASTVCVCDIGFEGVGSLECYPCPTNMYKETAGNFLCVPCGANATTSGRTASPRCSCPSNFYGDPKISCTRCPALTYRLGTASYTTGISDCTNEATCRPGFYGDPSTDNCTACPEGTYKVNATTQLTTIADCIKCAPNSATLVPQGATLPSQCACKPGFYGNGSTQCIPCRSDTYKSEVADGDVNSCVGCFANSTTFSKKAATSIDDCLCRGSLIRNGSMTCVSCPIGGYKTGINTCAFCPAGSYFSGSDQMPCLLCQDNTYQPNIGQLQCLSCGGNATSNGTGSTTCFCPDNYFGDPRVSCTSCPPNRYRLGVTSDVTIQAMCQEPPKCPPNFYGTPGDCMRCPGLLVRYRDAFNTTTVDDCICPLIGPCVICDNNAVPVVGRDVCECEHGYHNVSGSCLPCPKGTYKPEAGNDTCTECPIDTFSTEIGATSLSTCLPCVANSRTGNLTGANSSLACLCSPGYIGFGGENCTACPMDSYKESYGNGFCFPCTSGLSTNGETASTSCSYCAVNYEGTAPDCQKCARGYEKTLIGNGACQEIPDISRSALASKLGMTDTALFIFIGMAAAFVGAVIVVFATVKRSQQYRRLAMDPQARSKLPILSGLPSLLGRGSYGPLIPAGPFVVQGAADGTTATIPISAMHSASPKTLSLGNPLVISDNSGNPTSQFSPVVVNAQQTGMTTWNYTIRPGFGTGTAGPFVTNTFNPSQSQFIPSPTFAHQQMISFINPSATIVAPTIAHNNNDNNNNNNQ